MAFALKLFSKPRPNPLAEAQQNRAAAYARLREAEQAGDTRMIGFYRMVLTQCTTEELSLVVHG